MTLKSAILFFLASICVRVFACQPAQVQFEGTAFAKTPLQIEANKIYFFRGSKHEVTFAFSPRRQKWCYSDDDPYDAHPKLGCLDRKLEDGKRILLIEGKRAKSFAIRDSDNKPVATVSVIGRVMTANFLGRDGKPLGKRIVFKSVMKELSEILEVRGWNCPNPKFLSCVGSDLTAILEPQQPSAIQAAQSDPAQPVSQPAIVKVADLAKRLGHYQFSCAGISEHSAAAASETKRAPSLTEPE